jgi:5-methylcytosine-specific restriction endonuclease McrA
MSADRIFSNVGVFARHPRKRRAQRRNRVKDRISRAGLTRKQRHIILSKTGGRCYICGGAIDGEAWHADHVLAHAVGGKHSVDNYLPAHSICNKYRWYYGAEEFQWIRKLGVWLRTHIEKGTSIGQETGQRFCEYEWRRDGRRKQ